jgi:hypothetical protein
VDVPLFSYSFSAFFHGHRRPRLAEAAVLETQSSQQQAALLMLLKAAVFPGFFNSPRVGRILVATLW